MRVFLFIVINGDYQFCCPGAAGAEIDKQFHYQVGQKDWHHYKIEFTPPTGKKLQFKTIVDKGKFEAEGKIDIGVKHSSHKMHRKLVVNHTDFDDTGVRADLCVCPFRKLPLAGEENKVLLTKFCFPYRTIRKK